MFVPKMLVPKNLPHSHAGSWERGENILKRLRVLKHLNKFHEIKICEKLEVVSLQQFG